MPGITPPSEETENTIGVDEKDLASSSKVTVLPPLALSTWMRPTIAISILMAIVHIVSLQKRRAIFGGDSLWFTNVKYVNWSERIGLSLAILLLTFTLCSAWMYAWHTLSRRCNWPQGRCLHLAITGWVMFLFTDQFLYWKIHIYMGPAFDFTGFSAGVGSWSKVLGKALRWFWADIYELLACLILMAIASYGLYKIRPPKPRRTETPYPDHVRKPLKRMFLSTLLICLCLFTFLTPWWSTTKLLLSMDSSLGIPFQWTISVLTDFDGDDYGPFDAPADSAPFDSERHPYAVEIPDDGIDQDLLLGDLKLSDLPPFMKKEIEALKDYPSLVSQKRPNLVYVSLESVRFDALGKIIDGKRVMPHLQSWVKDKKTLLIPEFYASKGFTTTSIPEIFHGSLFPTETTLIDDLKNNDYQVIVASGYNLEDEGLARPTGLDQSDKMIAPGFVDEELIDGFRINALTLMDQLALFFANSPPSSPFFLYVHFTDPHFPYDQMNPHVFSKGPIEMDDIDLEHHDALERIYFNQVHHVDKAIRLLENLLREHGLWEDTIIMLVSDHGESLFDDDYLVGHGTAINEVMTHCLAVIRNSPIDFPTPVSHYHLRHLIRRMLTEEPVGQPVIQPMPDRNILHYLGWLDRPYRIGSYSRKNGRVWFDFRNERTYHSLDDVEGALDSSMNSEQYAAISALIQQWEYLQYIHR